MYERGFARAVPNDPLLPTRQERGVGGAASERSFKARSYFNHSKCLSKLGTQPQHAAFIEMLVPSLLKLDRYDCVPG